MKNRYTGEGEPRSLFDAIERHLKNRKKHNAIGETCGIGFVFYTYERLINDAMGAAILMSELAEPSDPITVGASAYDTAVMILAASVLSRSIIISDPGESLTFNGIVITNKNTYSPRFISPSELRTLIAGVLSRGTPALPTCERGNAEISFRAGGQSDTYSERAALLSAAAFNAGCAIAKNDRLISLFTPSSPEGLFCGILAPLIAGSSSAVCADARSTVRYMRSLSPTKLFCPTEVAGAILLKILRIKKKFPRTSYSHSPLDTTRLWINRLSHPRISYLLGGRLRALIVAGEIPEGSANALFSFGIYSIMMRSVRGLSPALFRYAGDRIGKWSLPLGADADMRNVQKGGVGNLVLSSEGVRMGESVGHTYAENEKLSKTSLITPLKCFIMKNGGVFLVKK